MRRSPGSFSGLLTRDGRSFWEYGWCAQPSPGTAVKFAQSAVVRGARFASTHARSRRNSSGGTAPVPRRPPVLDVLPMRTVAFVRAAFTAGYAARTIAR